MIKTSFIKSLVFSILIFSDSIVLWLGIYCAYHIRKILDTYFTTPLDDHFSLYNGLDIYYLCILFLFIYEGIYHKHMDFWEEIKRIYKALFFGFLFLFTWLALTKSNLEYSRAIIIYDFLVLLVFFPVSKRIIKWVLVKIHLWAKPVQLIGNDEQCEVLKKEIKDNWYLGLVCVLKANSIIISTKGYSYEALIKLSERYLLGNKEVMFVPTLTHINFADTDIMEMYNIRYSLLRIENKLQQPLNNIIKYIIGFVFSILLLPLLMPIFVILIILIKIDSKGPAFFIQRRLGQKSEVFECFKFRTMLMNGEQILQDYLLKHPEEVAYYAKYHKYQKDPRVTSMGKFLRKTSLDELPQIINVLRGEMSIVGPRPYMASERHKLKEIRHDILLVRPGITGLWQVSGRSDVDFEGRVELDRWYIRNWSLWLDLVILVKTIKVVFFGKGAR